MSDMSPVWQAPKLFSEALVALSVSILFIEKGLTTNLQWQYQAGIYRDKTMASKLVYNPNDATQNYPFCI